MIKVSEYINNPNLASPCFVKGDALVVLRSIPNDYCIDCVVTSPPYYMKRQYLGGGIGLEKTYQEYIDNILAITKEIYRVLKPTGLFWCIYAWKTTPGSTGGKKRAEPKIDRRAKSKPIQ